MTNDNDKQSASNRPTHNVLAITTDADGQEYRRYVGPGWERDDGVSVWIPRTAGITTTTRLVVRARGGAKPSTGSAPQTNAD